ncbi:hypothetical protein EVJ58_g587 [Rhodofomes roseus]|uniref:Uncharacterized protein n=1 Tax=Rhodofomes roseus TaxID=34475 RepID=A0A4Y9Z4Y8_9APHY|nr:hypothetical protein EVJ58_g587 [Rhodofomes roseus]
MPTISRRKVKEPAAEAGPERHTADGAPDALRSKRRLSTPSEDEAPRHSRKRFRSAAPSDYMSELGSDRAHPIPVDDEEDEVEDLLVESSKGSSMPPGSHKPSKKTASRSKPMNTAFDDVQEIDMVDLTADDLDNGHSGNVPPTNTAKRKISPEPRVRSPSKSGEASTNSSDYAEGQTRKRHRTVSPGASKHEYEAKRTERERRRMESFKARFDSNRAAWHDRFLHDLMTGIPEDFGSGGNTHGAPNQGSLDEEALRQAAIEESRRKLAELEKDKPLWEEASRRRMEAERAEEERRRVQSEAQRQAAEAEARRRRQEAERAEAERRARAARENAAHEQEQRRRQQQQQRWSYGPWTTARALERYKVLSETFDSAKFAEDSPATFNVIPWPVLRSPAMLSIEDIDWNAVEAFFRKAIGASTQTVGGQEES